MMQIIVAPDSRLNQFSKKVEIIDDSIISTLDQMLECMYQNNGIGQFHYFDTCILTFDLK